MLVLELPQLFLCYVLLYHYQPTQEQMSIDAFICQLVHDLETHPQHSCYLDYYYMLLVCGLPEEGDGGTDV